MEAVKTSKQKEGITVHPRVQCQPHILVGMDVLYPLEVDKQRAQQYCQQ